MQNACYTITVMQLKLLAGLNLPYITSVTPEIKSMGLNPRKPCVLSDNKKTTLFAVGQQKCSPGLKSSIKNLHPKGFT